LVTVAAVCKKDAASVRYQQYGRASGEAGEVMNIWQVRDQQGVKSIVRECGLKAQDSRGMIHFLHRG
jgi:hypothetical protein